MFVATVNVTIRELDPQNPNDVVKVSVSEAKGTGESPESAFRGAYERSGLQDFVDNMSSGIKLVRPS